MERLLTTQEVMEYFNVKDNRMIAKFRKNGMKYIPIGQKDYRYRIEDIKDYIQSITRTDQVIIPIKKGCKNKTINIDFEKRKANLELNKVI